MSSDNTQPTHPLPTTDHDAIITLIAEMRSLRGEVKDIKVDIKEVKENVADRVTDLEREKMDKDAAEKLLNDANIVHKDLHDRLTTAERFIENFKGRYAIMAVMGGVLVSVITTLIVITITQIANK